MKGQKALVGAALCCMAQLAHGDWRSDFYEQYYSKNFRGWKGIVFVCSFEKADDVLERICDRASTDLKLLAASNKVKLAVVPPNMVGEASFISNRDRYLTLGYNLIATKRNHPSEAVAVHGQFSYSVFFVRAAEADATPKSHDSLPRSGDLVIWERTALGSGQANEIVHPFSDHAESLLKEAMTLFITHAK